MGASHRPGIAQDTEVVGGSSSNLAVRLSLHCVSSHIHRFEIGGSFVRVEPLYSMSTSIVFFVAAFAHLQAGSVELLSVYSI